jgi:hypothetical protein
MLRSARALRLLGAAAAAFGARFIVHGAFWLVLSVAVTGDTVAPDPVEDVAIADGQMGTFLGEHENG